MAGDTGATAGRRAPGGYCLPGPFIGDLFYTLYRVVTFQVEEIRWSRIGHDIYGLAD